MNAAWNDLACSGRQSLDESPEVDDGARFWEWRLRTTPRRPCSLLLRTPCHGCSEQSNRAPCRDLALPHFLNRERQLRLVRTPLSTQHLRFFILKGLVSPCIIPGSVSPQPLGTPGSRSQALFGEHPASQTLISSGGVCSGVNFGQIKSL